MAGSCHWQLVFERWADHRLGDAKPTPRKHTVVFRAYWVKILKEGIYRVMDEDKYHGHIPGPTLSRPSALCDRDMQRDTGVRVSPCPACHRGQQGQKIAWRSPPGLVPPTF